MCCIVLLLPALSSSFFYCLIGKWMGDKLWRDITDCLCKQHDFYRIDDIAICFMRSVWYDISISNIRYFLPLPLHNQWQNPFTYLLIDFSGKQMRGTFWFSIPQKQPHRSKRKKKQKRKKRTWKTLKKRNTSTWKTIPMSIESFKRLYDSGMQKP